MHEKNNGRDLKKIEIVDLVLTLIVIGVTEGQKSVGWRGEEGESESQQVRGHTRACI